MSPKIYTQEFKESAVKFYERNHTIDETIVEFNISESSLFEWRKKYMQAHDLIINGTPKYKNYQQKQLHLQKLDILLDLIKRIDCSQTATIDEKYAVVKKYEWQYSIRVLCEAVALSRGTYYNRKRKENTVNSYEENDKIIKPLIKQIFYGSKERFGRKPIRYKLRELGYNVSEKRICRLMKEMGLEVKRPQYMAEHLKPIPRMYLKNNLHQNFEQSAPNMVWVSDITYVKVGMQYYFICVILDLFSRKVISYGISENIDAVLVLKTFDAAYDLRGKPTGLMFHSDQGAQYTSYVFREHLKNLNVRTSFSTPGNPYDNSVCESFFHTLKKEAVYHYLYDTPEDLQVVLEEYIHFYNEERPHRKLNMKTPAQFELEFILH